MLGDLSKKDVKVIQNQFDDCVKRISHQYDMKNYEKARLLIGNFLMYFQSRRDFGYVLHPNYTDKQIKKINKILNKRILIKKWRW